MKNIQVIDGAKNCSFSIYAASDEDFSLIFPLPGQDIEFIEDVVERLGESLTGELVLRATSRRIEKPNLKNRKGVTTHFSPILETPKPNGSIVGR